MKQAYSRSDSESFIDLPLFESQCVAVYYSIHKNSMLHKRNWNTGQYLRNISSCFHCVFLSLSADRARDVSFVYRATPIVAHGNPFVNSHSCFADGDPALFPAIKTMTLSVETKF